MKKASPQQADGGSHSISASNRPRDCVVVQLSAVNCKPCRNGGPTARPPGDSTQTITASAVSGPLIVSIASSTAAPGGRISGRRSKIPPRLMSPVDPWTGFRARCPLGWQMTAISSGSRTPAWPRTPLRQTRSRRAWCCSTEIWLKAIPWGTPPSFDPGSPTQVTFASPSMAPPSVRMRIRRGVWGRRRSASSAHAPPSLRSRVQPTAILPGAGVARVYRSGSWIA